ncbi:alpha/beta hydrolase [Kribbella sandramycini]|uniref:Alpha/beta hydrolase n=1 Tax=Kribbella sandramycini TaxID=60450 RepID=A0A7Y4KYR1_9ACTN|nr:alpha/beta hydrolase [Kribbella sandramycini]MBB6569018.1 dienelactone hydrolase [Kribbella sandramycini]NOL41138.1 alpha/beta hydrolase [Kribbella sandramycini]
MKRLLTAAAALLLSVVWLPSATASPGHRVGVAAYSLGDSVFDLPPGADGTKAKGELTAVVHYPLDLTGRRYPVVLISHGLWISCADRKAWQDEDWEKLDAWPCAPGTPEIPNYRGYDYLGAKLAAQGMIVISISANGSKAFMGQEQDAARAALINEHLRMWQQLSSTGRGPLAGKLPVNFKGHADLTNVGLMGHSRGGRGTLFYAADQNQKNWPRGVEVKAVVPLAPAEPYSPDENPDSPELDAYRITNIPVGGIIGSCDGAVQGRVYNYLQAHNKAPLYEWYVRGANHNFFNTQWSPSSGQVGAEDDAPADCGDRRLSEPQQRATGTAYVSAFFRRYLLNDRSGMRLLTGAVKPGPVDVRVDQGVGSRR